MCARPIECSSNCSCMAYAYASLSNSGATADPSRCLVWTGELVDTGKLVNYGDNLYLHVADSPDKDTDIFNTTRQIYVR